MNILWCFKGLMYTIMISLGFAHQVLAKQTSPMVRPGVAGQDSERYFYVGVLAQLGYARLNYHHPALLFDGSLDKEYTFSRGGRMIELLVGRQWMQYVATTCTFEWLLNYGGKKVGLFSSDPIKTDFEFYTVGFGLECMPMLPVSDHLSLVAILGIGYKKANIKREGNRILDPMGWKFIPKLGAGVIVNRKHDSISLKLLCEFNNLFRYDNQNVFSPFIGFAASYCFKF